MTYFSSKIRLTHFLTSLLLSPTLCLGTDPSAKGLGLEGESTVSLSKVESSRLVSKDIQRQLKKAEKRMPPMLIGERSKRNLPSALCTSLILPYLSSRDYSRLMATSKEWLGFVEGQPDRKAELYAQAAHYWEERIKKGNYSPDVLGDAANAYLCWADNLPEDQEVEKVRLFAKAAHYFEERIRKGDCPLRALEYAAITYKNWADNLPESQQDKKAELYAKAHYFEERINKIRLYTQTADYYEERIKKGNYTPTVLDRAANIYQALADISEPAQREGLLRKAAEYRKRAAKMKAEEHKAEKTDGKEEKR